MIQNGNEEVVVELEGIRELLGYLPDTVDELQENGRTICVRMVIISMADPLKIYKKIRIGKNKTVKKLKLPVGICVQTKPTPFQSTPRNPLLFCNRDLTSTLRGQ